MDNIIKGNSGNWEVVIGLETHAQIITKSKLFSSESTAFGSQPNSQVSFIDAGFPGMLPRLNKHAVLQAVKTGIGLNAKINLHSTFDRKNYFYADLPTGYQITQFYNPIVENGYINIDLEDASSKKIGITRIHIEQDAGKSLHDQSQTETFIDLNRAGVALMEIVSEPDIRSSFEAGQYIKKLRSILRCLETCDGDMEKGSLRCDANVSVRRVGNPKFGTRVEIKNVNSIKNVVKAIDYEVRRQIDLIESGSHVLQETRLFDATTNETRSMRSKEDVQDYRYFPEPDLGELILTEDYIKSIQSQMPELPDEKVKRYISDLGLSHYDASVLVAEKSVSAFFEETIQHCDAKLASNWIAGELFARLNKSMIDIASSPISPKKLSEMIALIQDNTISGKIAKQVFDIMFSEGLNAKEVIEKYSLVQVNDDSLINEIVAKVISENLDKVAEYKSGKDKLFGFFVGQVMKLSQGKANPTSVNEILKKSLS